MSTGENTGLGIFAIIVFVIIVGAAVGWVKNIVGFCKADFESPYKVEIIRGLGIPFAPVGAIVGWIPIKDGKVVEVESFETLEKDYILKP